MKEALIYWRKYEKVEREQRKKAEKEAMEQRKRDDEMREVSCLKFSFPCQHLEWNGIYFETTLDTLQFGLKLETIKTSCLGIFLWGGV